MALPVLTKEEIIQQLAHGTQWEGSTITYRVAQTVEGLTSPMSEADGFTPASPYVAHYFEMAMELWDDLVKVDFVKTNAADSDIEIAFSDVGVDFAHAYFPEYGGSIWLHSERVEPDFSLGSYSFLTMAHEAGHALGLNHMGNYDGDFVTLPSAFQDSQVYSIMSYFGPKGSAVLPDSQVQQAVWTDSDGKTYSAQTPMLNDVLAIQSIYGVSTTTRTGNTTYGFNYNAELGKAELYDFSLNLNPILTIFDSAGNDTLNLSGWSTSATIFLEAGKFSSCNDMTNNLAIAYGCVIENAVGGSGSDAITGNQVANRLSGLAGNDRLEGLGGADVLIGGAGADTLIGGAGVDTLIGGAGNDVYFVDNASDVVMESSWTPGETDTVHASVSYRLAPGLMVESLKLLGKNALNGTGNELANGLTGNFGDNVLNGAAGADTLDGGAGTDTLIGGTGNDTYMVRETGDVVKESSTASDEIDTVLSFIDFTLGANLENLELLGLAALKGTGNAADNRLTGNFGDNVLNGAAGADTLDGGEGANTLIGGTGDDTYVVRRNGDVVKESSTASDEIDTVVSFIDFTLGANLENLELLGLADLKGTGNAADNRLTGNAGDNVLNGGAGADMLGGAAGADTLIGGTGNDIYVVRDATDVVRESSTVSTEIDTVRSYVDFKLGANLENLQLRGVADLKGTGNVADNRLTGNAGDNVLNGGAGADMLIGSLGSDTLIGGGGADRLTGGSGRDRFSFTDWTDLGLGTLRDVITDFSAGQDRIDLSRIDANTALAGDQAFELVTTGFGLKAGQLRYSEGMVSINTDTDAEVEFQIQLIGTLPMALSASDFVL